MLVYAGRLSNVSNDNINDKGFFDIPEDVIAIENYAFEGCTRLTKINIPDRVITIGKGAFQNCSDLKEIKLPKGITTISKRMFQSCSQLRYVDIHDGVISIGDYAFDDCTNLKEINIPKSTTSIGHSAFYACRRMEKINLPETLTSIETIAFFSCESLKRITIPKHLTSIKYLLFGGCKKLQQITFSENITSIDTTVFIDCVQLKTILIKSLDDRKRNNIIQMLTQELRNLVVSKELTEQIIRIEDQQLKRILYTPETNPLYRFFSSKGGKENVPLFPKELFIPINMYASLHNSYYVEAQALIDTISLPQTQEEIPTYENEMKKIINDCLAKTIDFNGGAKPENSVSSLFNG